MLCFIAGKQDEVSYMYRTVLARLHSCISKSLFRTALYALKSSSCLSKTDF